MYFANGYKLGFPVAGAFTIGNVILSKHERTYLDDVALDFPAEGVVLLTSDGDLAQAMSKKSQSVPMTYHLKMQGPVGDDEITRLLRGWRWENRPVRPVRQADWRGRA